MNKIGLTLIVLLLIAALGASVFFYLQFQKTSAEIAALKQNAPAAQAMAEKKREIVAILSSMAELPKDEEPSLITITDIDKLKDQPFFSLAANGDEVLIYKESKRAIIYRPATKKIVDMAQVNLADELDEAPSQTSQQIIIDSSSPTSSPSAGEAD
jgi:virulence-associated protein VagC